MPKILYAVEKTAAFSLCKTNKSNLLQVMKHLTESPDLLKALLNEKKSGQFRFPCDPFLNQAVQQTGEQPSNFYTTAL